MSLRYWVNVSGDKQWSNPSNWSDSSGGVGGAGVPTSADDVIFDGACTDYCFLTGNIECKSIDMQAAYTGRIYCGSSTVHVYGDVTLAATSGYFYGETSQWTIDGNFDFSTLSAMVYGTSVFTFTGVAKTLTFKSSGYLYKAIVNAGSSLTITHGGTGNAAVYFYGGLEVHGTVHCGSTSYVIVRYKGVVVGSSGLIDGFYFNTRDLNYYDDGSSVQNDGQINNDLWYIDYPRNNAVVKVGTTGTTTQVRVYTSGYEASVHLKDANIQYYLRVRNDGSSGLTTTISGTFDITGHLYWILNGTGTNKIIFDPATSFTCSLLDLYGTGTGNAELDANNVDVGSINVDHAGSLVLLSDCTASGGLTIVDGGFDADVYDLTAGNMLLNGSGDVYFGSGSHEIDSFTVTGIGNLYSESATIVCHGKYDTTLATGTNVHGVSTWIFDTDTTISSTASNEWHHFYNLTIDADVTINTSYCISSGDLTINAGRTLTLDKYIITYGDILIPGGTGTIAGNSNLYIYSSYKNVQAGNYVCGKIFYRNRSTTLEAGTYAPSQHFVFFTPEVHSGWILGTGDFIFDCNVVKYGSADSGMDLSANPNMEFRGKVDFDNGSAGNVTWTKGTGTITLAQTLNTYADFFNIANMEPLVFASNYEVTIKQANNMLLSGTSNGSVVLESGSITLNNSLAVEHLTVGNANFSCSGNDLDVDTAFIANGTGNLDFGDGNQHTFGSTSITGSGDVEFGSSMFYCSGDVSIAGTGVYASDQSVWFFDAGSGGTQTVDLANLILSMVTINADGTVVFSNGFEADSITRLKGQTTFQAATYTAGSIQVNGGGDFDLGDATLSGTPPVTVNTTSGITTLPTCSIASLAVTAGDINISGRTIAVIGDVTMSSGSRFWNGTSADMNNAMIDYGGDLDMRGTSIAPLTINNLDFANAPATMSYCEYVHVTNSQRLAAGGDIRAFATDGGVDGGGNVGWIFTSSLAHLAISDQTRYTLTISHTGDPDG